MKKGCPIGQEKKTGGGKTSRYGKSFILKKVGEGGTTSIEFRDGKRLKNVLLERSSVRGALLLTERKGKKKNIVGKSFLEKFGMKIERVSELAS